MSMFRRRVLASPIGNALPAEYRRVPFLEGTGTQYIDLGRKFYSANRYFLVAGYYANPNVGTRIFGARNSSNITPSYSGELIRLSYISYSSDNTGADTSIYYSPCVFVCHVYNWEVVRTGNYTNKLDQFFSYEICAADKTWRCEALAQYNKKSVRTIGLGRIQPTTNAGNAYYSDYNMYLFTENTAGSATPRKCRIKAFKITNIDGTVVRMELVPCVRRADGEAGMYDVVSGSFLTNAGTGKFLTGTEI